ncbi:putative methyltransferase-domain-containing protein [Phlyctochytrium arcticum]|nr:putative methyltransferase-domain-containing protein [Phlyctochytrium arcticum]
MREVPAYQEESSSSDNPPSTTSAAASDWLFIIEYQYLQGIPQRNFFWPENVPRPLSVSLQDDIVAATVCNPIAEKYPTPPDRTMQFLKRIMSFVETDQEEISDTLMSAFMSFMNLSHADLVFNPPECFKSYRVPCNLDQSLLTTDGHASRYITLRESVSLTSGGTTGLTTWEAAMRLSEYLLFTDPQIVRKKKVVELGAGLGLVGFVCGHIGATEVHLTDVNDAVLQRLQQNVDIYATGILSEDNPGQRPAMTVASLDWENVDAQSIEKYDTDVVLAADVVYDPSLIAPLTEVLKLFLQTNRSKDRSPIQVFIASTHRQETTQNMFRNSLESAGIVIHEFDLHDVPRWFYRDDIGTPVVKLLQLTLPL